MESKILNELNGFKELYGKTNDNVALQWIERQIRDFRAVKMARATDVLPPDALAYIRNIIKPQPKQCYRNAYELAQLPGFTYCEGFVFCFFNIEHAFNKYTDADGNEYYIDITFEFVLGEDVTAREYAVLGEYQQDQLCEAITRTNHFGDVYRHFFIKEYEKHLTRT